MESLKCPNCGGNIIKTDDDIFFCPYCGIGIPSTTRKTKLQIEIKSEENKTITKRDKAKEYEKLAELIFTIFIVVAFLAFMIVIFASH